ncbi:MFS transporter [Amycolatopsis sp. DSM 110486]|uniref:MFS transporter n=1 Tax=Amycolatopsis sp. DSM 110486 TaxID=2865832 RepID=UPI001C6A22B7|nr:MFS transporter [Amycolatopsis sp. DSM 110486]QYN18580.1 MFS transporter [Amycolatopsis sp. DSM 110486]
MSTSAAGRTTLPGTKAKTSGQRAARAAFYGLLVDYWEIMLPVIALGPAIEYFLPSTLPPQTKSTLTFLTFAAAFLGRPIGSVIFGHLADTLCRRRTTVVCSVGMGFAVLLVAFLPGYESVGMWGLAGVLLLRLLGGIFMGGQYTGANPLAMESAEKSRRGVVGGFIASAWPVSYVAVSLLTAVLVVVFPSGSATSAYATWGWRIPFLIGAVMAFVLFAYARKTAESQAWAANKAKEEQAAKTRSPLRELFRGDNLRSLGQVFLLMTGIWFAIQMLTVAPSGLLISYLHLPSQTVIWGILAANVVLFPCYLLLGAWGQRFGRRRTLIVCGVLTGTVSVGCVIGMLRTLGTGGPFWLAMVFFTIALCISVAPNAVLIPYLCERFHVGVRASGYGIGFTLAVIVPGLYSFMLIGLGKVISYEYGVAVLLVIGAVCTVAGAVLGPETKDVDLDTPAA